MKKTSHLFRLGYSYQHYINLNSDNFNSIVMGMKAKPLKFDIHLIHIRNIRMLSTFKRNNCSIICSHNANNFLSCIPWMQFASVNTNIQCTISLTLTCSFSCSSNTFVADCTLFHLHFVFQLFIKYFCDSSTGRIDISHTIYRMKFCIRISLWIVSSVKMNEIINIIRTICYAFINK